MPKSRTPRTGANKEANRAKRQAKGMGSNKAAKRSQKASSMGSKKTRGY